MRFTCLVVGLVGLVVAANAEAAVRLASRPATRAATRPAATRSVAAVSPEARALLEKMSAAYARVTAIEMSGTIRGEFDLGQKRTEEEQFTSSLLVPNRFRHELKSNLHLGSTGEKAYVYSASANEYVMKDAPKERSMLRAWPAPLPEVLALASPPLNISTNPSLAMALSKDAAAELTGPAKEIAKAADVEIDGKNYPALDVTFAQPAVRVTLALDPESNLIRRATTDLKVLMEKAGAPDVKTAQIVVDYTTIRPNVAFQAGQFGWTPPAGARDASGAAASADADDDDDDDVHAHEQALVGQPAPDFALKDAAGKEVKLGALKGSVVVLDFWATWCGPCRASMPHLQELHQNKDLAAGGLKLYTINLRETPEKVNEFFAKEKLSLPVLFDSDGAVAKEYGVRGIPTTVVIGRDGKVAKVFVGMQEGALQAAIDEAIKAK